MPLFASRRNLPPMRAMFFVPALFLVGSAFAGPLTLPPGMSALPVLPLSLAEARDLALSRNLDAVAARAMGDAARARQEEAAAAWEPWIEAGYGHDSAQEPPQSALDGDADELYTESYDRLDLGLGETTPLGTELSLDWSHARSGSTLSTALQPLLWRSALNFSLRQPLLRGFAFNPRIPLASALHASSSAQASEQDARAAVASVIEQVEGAYWDLRLAIAAWGVQDASTDTARQQLALTERQIEDGVLPPSDRIQAQSTLARRELQMVQNRAAIEAGSDRLRGLLHLPREDWERPLLPIDDPPEPGEGVSIDLGLAAAEATRPELLAARVDEEAAALDVIVATNSVLPSLDLDLGLGLVGQDEIGSESLRKMGSRDAWNWSVGLALRWSPMVRAGAARLHGARANLRLARSRSMAQNMDVVMEVRAAFRARSTAIEQVAAAARFREFAERSQDVEERRWKDGLTTNFVVAARQDEVRQARLAELEARVSFAKAAAAWSRATGGSLSMIDSPRP